MSKHFSIGRAAVLSSVYSLGLLVPALWKIAGLAPDAGLVVWMAIVAILLPASILFGSLLAMNFHFAGHTEEPAADSGESKSRDLVRAA